MSEQEIAKVCVIGLGSMGLGIGLSLLRRGFRTSGYDINAEAMAKFSAAGGDACRSPAEAGEGADAVICVVVNAAQTEAALFAGDGAAQAMKKGGAILSCATMEPQMSEHLAARAMEAGIGFIDGPISGGAAKAAAGELTVMGSGPKQTFEFLRPVLQAISARTYELGEKPGIGSSFKIVNQLLAGVHIAAACEAITFAKALGLDIEKVYEVICASAGNSWMFENRVPHILEGDYSPRSAVDIFNKDLGIVSHLGHAMKFPLPLSSAALQMFVMTSAAGMGKDDDASIARFIAGVSGIDLPGKTD
jgi:3-hydroxyisobutyrate dehydrogenase